jgi:hypothetical protein
MTGDKGASHTSGVPTVSLVLASVLQSKTEIGTHIIAFCHHCSLTHALTDDYAGLYRNTV